MWNGNANIVVIASGRSTLAGVPADVVVVVAAAAVDDDARFLRVFLYPTNVRSVPKPVI